jgi:hypothetical protein
LNRLYLGNISYLAKYLGYCLLYYALSAFNVAVRGRAVQTYTLIDCKKGCPLPEIKKGEKIARSLLTAWLKADFACYLATI